MPEIGTSGSMSGDGKRGVGHRPQATAPILDSTACTSTCATGDQTVKTIVRSEEKPDPRSKDRWFEPSIGVRNQAHRRLHSANIFGGCFTKRKGFGARNSK